MPRKRDTANMLGLLDDFFRGVRRKLDAGARGPGAFNGLLGSISRHLGASDPGAALAKLNFLGVFTGTPTCTYARSWMLLVASVAGGKREMAPTTEMVAFSVRTSVSNELPSLVPLLLPVTPAKQPAPYQPLDNI